MKENSINSEYAYQVLKEDYSTYKEQGDNTSFRKWVELSAESDPDFFRWIFNVSSMNYKCL